MEDRRFTDSGIEVRPLYVEADLGEGWDPSQKLGTPGEYPYTRGIHPLMYRQRPWTIRQYSGYGMAEATNERWKLLLAAGGTGLSCAFDLPTQMGYDSDHPRAEGEVGRVGVAIDSIDDMRVLLDGLPLDQVTVSMTINATAMILLLLYELVAEERGIPSSQLRGTVQNDILKEYISRGTYIYPPLPSMRLTTDLFAYCREHTPLWNTISVSGYHIREAGATAVQELGFTLANGVEYLNVARAAGLDVDDVAPRISFFWNGHSNFFEEVAKYRAARRMWAAIMRDRFGTSNPASQRMRFHTQTAGSTLTAQQAENNIVRVTLQALSAVLGGTQSLHTNGFDEALGLPTESSARLALRTQQIIAGETGVTDTVDPLAGSWYVERLTDEVEAGAWQYLARIDELGGARAAIEEQFQQSEIERSAYATATAIERREKIVVGVNRHGGEESVAPPVFPLDAEQVARQVDRVRATRAQREPAAVEHALLELESAARGDANVAPHVKRALAARATLGEVSDVFRRVFGEYHVR